MDNVMLTFLVGGIKFLFGVLLAATIGLVVLIVLLGLFLDFMKWLFDVK